MYTNKNIIIYIWIGSYSYKNKNNYTSNCIWIHVSIPGLLCEYHWRQAKWNVFLRSLQWVWIYSRLCDIFLKNYKSTNTRHIYNYKSFYTITTIYKITNMIKWLYTQEA